MAIVNGSSTVLASLGPLELGNFDKAEGDVHRPGGGHRPKGLESDSCVTLGSGVLHETCEDRTADAELLGCGTNEHPLDFRCRVVNRLECAHADRVLVQAGHEQPTARAERPRKFGTEPVVVAGQVGFGERDAGFLLEVIGNPFAVLAEQWVDHRRHICGCDGGNG